MRRLAFLILLLPGHAWAGPGNIAFLEQYGLHHAGNSSDHAPIHNGLLSYAKRFLGMGNVTGFRGPWCGAFVGKIARHEGLHVPRGYLQARQWAHAGKRTGAHVGAVMVMRHHVGIVAAVHGRTVTLLGGNQGHRVSLERRRISSALAFVQLARN